MLKIPEKPLNYHERNRICRREEIWDERQFHIYKDIKAKFEGEVKEKEMEKFWWMIDSDTFTLMYGHERRLW